MSDSPPVFIGDEASAAGYRLAGLQVRVASAQTVLAEVQAASEQAPLVLISSELAGHLPGPERERLLARREPLLLVVPDVRGRAPLMDLASQLRRQLGVLE
jgi:vacuolar-type H+-ATPase subunit F/Vma7